MLHRDPIGFAAPALPEEISVVGASAGLRPDRFAAVVTLPTFRRPEQVLATLESLAKQQTARAFAVIVMENDDEGRQGADAAMRRLGVGDLPGLVLIAHERGNCSAYNAGWLTALETFPNFRHLLVIDDDEIAEPRWLDTMIDASERFDADIVGGPQIPQFDAGGDERFTSHPVFAAPYRSSGPVAALYSSGNLAIRRRVLEAMGPPFLDLKFNFMGGGDSDFLSRSAQRGFQFAWSAEGRVLETVPARRLDAGWVRARSLRNGVISTLVEQKKRAEQPAGRLRVFAKSLALLAASPFRAAARLIRGEQPTSAIYPIHVAVGRVLAEFGYANEQYRNPEKN
jgi:hypothetical protein